MTVEPIKYRSGYKYQLAEDVFHVLPPVFDSVNAFNDGFLRWSPSILTIKAGYAWDGASGIAVDTPDFMRGSLVHDALYQCIRQGYIDRSLKNACDEELKRVCIEDGMSAFRASYVYEAVKVFGHESMVNLKTVHTAPCS